MGATSALSTPRAALLWSMRFGNTQMFKILLQGGANPNTVGDCGNSALGLAVNSHQNKVVELLLEYGASISVTNAYDEPPIYLAVVNWDFSSQHATKI